MKRLYPIALLLIITAPAFMRLINNGYFSMHDDQHIVRLYLLKQGISQGALYPRWVDGLGFGLGYPLFNFYPPLIYYLALFFNLMGFSLIWSIKLVVIAGFILGAGGVYLFVKRHAGKVAGLVSATVYTYFFYHAVVVYVRGALAEFFSMAVLPFVFLAISVLADIKTIRNSALFGISFATLILTHPLIAFPAVFYIGFFFLFYLCTTQNKLRFTILFSIGLALALSLSAFFWLPSMIERKYTLVDSILIKELANYKIHYIYLRQFWYSLWGYGGSIAGGEDGMTFQLGKIPLFLTGLSFVLYIGHLSRLNGKQLTKNQQSYLFFLFLLFASLFMTTAYSSFIWDRLRYLWYLQFPWRFLTFSAFFLSLTAGYIMHFQPRGLHRITATALISIFFIVFTIVVYQKYFKPQKILSTNDQLLTTKDEITLRVSRSSFEFIPKGVLTKKSELGTTIPAIEKTDRPQKLYKILSGNAYVIVKKNNFSEKKLSVAAQTPTMLQLNTFYFPGWTTVIKTNNTFKSLIISDNNDYKLITVQIPKGLHEVSFAFKDTPIRVAANYISLFSLFLIIICLWTPAKVFKALSFAIQKNK